MNNTPNSMYSTFKKVKANHVALSPLSFLPSAANLFPNKDAVVYGDRRYSWSQCYNRCRSLASAISKLGVSTGDTVSVIAANTPFGLINWKKKSAYFLVKTMRYLFHLELWLI